MYNDSKYTAKNIKEERGLSSFDLFVNSKKKGRIKLSVGGEYNVKNALAAIACASEMSIPLPKIKLGLKSFKGVKRRYERIGSLNGVLVIADYAHHPTEITACLDRAREEFKGKIHVVFQPHTYSRTIFLKDEFIFALSGISNLYLYKTYSARETYILGGGAKDLSESLSNSKYFEDIQELLISLKQKTDKNDVILVLGAGDLYDIFKSEINR